MLVWFVAAAFAAPQAAHSAGFRGTEFVPVTIPKPEVAIILNKQRVVTPVALELSQSFLPKVQESAGTKPF